MRDPSKGGEGSTELSGVDRTLLLRARAGDLGARGRVRDEIVVPAIRLARHLDPESASLWYEPTRDGLRDAMAAPQSQPTPRTRVLRRLLDRADVELSEPADGEPGLAQRALLHLAEDGMDPAELSEVLGLPADEIDLLIERWRQDAPRVTPMEVSLPSDDAVTDLLCGLDPQRSPVAPKSNLIWVFVVGVLVVAGLVVWFLWGGDVALEDVGFQLNRSPEAVWVIEAETPSSRLFPSDEDPVLFALGRNGAYYLDRKTQPRMRLGGREAVQWAALRGPSAWQVESPPKSPEIIQSRERLQDVRDAWQRIWALAVNPRTAGFENCEGQLPGGWHFATPKADGDRRILLRVNRSGDLRSFGLGSLRFVVKPRMGATPAFFDAATHLPQEALPR